jgi:hypothetical protein
MNMRWQCRPCGKIHEDLPLHYGTAAPALLFTIPEQERDHRVMLSPDLCLIDKQHGFIVGNLEIPIIGSLECFSWDVWVSLSLPIFKRAFQRWDQIGREAEPPYFGWLGTALPGYPDTLHLKTIVQSREVGRRPRVELEPSDHPLAVEQRNGMTWDRVREIAESAFHE